MALAVLIFSDGFGCIVNIYFSQAVYVLKGKGFGPKINCIKMKIPSSVNLSTESSPKIGHVFSDKISTVYCKSKS